MNYTEHYQLSQFESDDRIMKEDFNADNAKIDAAIAAAADSGLKVMLGTSPGSNEYPRTLTLPVTPLLLIWMGINDSTGIMGICTQEFGRLIGNGGIYDSAEYFTLSGNKLEIYSSLLFNKYKAPIRYFALY